MTDENTFEYWDNKLKENKAKYKAGELEKAEYQKNGRRIRVKRRKALKASAPSPPVIVDSGGPVTNTPPVPKKAKRQKRKKAKTVKDIGFGQQNGYFKDMTAAIDAMAQTELPYPKPTKANPKAMHLGKWQATPMPEIIKLGLESPKAAAIEILNRFKNKWLTTPTHYSSMRQGDLQFLCLGPVDNLVSYMIEDEEDEEDFGDEVSEEILG